MTIPVLMVVDGDPGSLATLDGTLRRRYGHDSLPAGRNPAAAWTLPRPPLPLETSLPGVFAAGDVRHGSVKRVASAVGEGSIATTQLTQYLAKQA